MYTAGEIISLTDVHLSEPDVAGTTLFQNSDDATWWILLLQLFCKILVHYITQNPGFSAYTQHWVLYTWDVLIMSISKVGKPLHEFEEDLSRSYLIWTSNLLNLNLESTFPEYVWGVWHTHVYQENVSIACEYLSYSDPTQMLFKCLIINANLCMIPKVE